MRRRDVLGAGGSAVLATLAGCVVGSSDTGSSDSSIPWRQEGEVYHPGHAMEMEMIGVAQTGALAVGLSYHHPIQFWTIAGQRRQRVPVQQKTDAVHLMASVWHRETGTVLPVGSGLQVTVERDDDLIARRAMWPMLSQQMGFHYGDNIIFPEWGVHTVTVDPGSPPFQQYGALGGAFEDANPVEFEFRFRLRSRNDLDVDRMSDRRGSRAALSPMEMEIQPISFAPSPGTGPGRLLAEGTSGDADIVVTATEESAGTYLAVSPRTPINAYVLPLMSLSVRVDRGDTTVSEGRLSAAVDPDRGYHYGTTLQDVELGDDMTITIDSPPQTARHTGYESAFLEMSDVTLTV